MNIYGASGHAKVIIDIILLNGMEKIDSILDDNPEIKEILGFKVIQPLEDHLQNEIPSIIAIGNNQIRKKVASTLVGEISEFLRHPSAVISPSAKIGRGTVIMPNAIINAEAQIGKHCIINSGAVVEHEVVLADFVHISPNAAIAGNVKIGEGSHIGMGAMVIPGIKIGKWTKIGAGAVIIENIPDFSVVVGNPGRLIRTEKSE